MPNHHIQNRIVAVLLFVLILGVGCTNKTDAEDDADLRATVNSDPKSRVVAMGVFNNKVPPDLTLDALRVDAQDRSEAMVGHWKGQFRRAQWDGQSPEIGEIEFYIQFDGQNWRINGDTFYTEVVPATDVIYKDRTLSFGMDSGMFDIEGRQFPYLIDLVSVDDQLRGLIRLRLETVGEFNVDRYHTMWLDKVPPEAIVPTDLSNL